MARLYCEVHSDRGKIHKVGNEKLRLKVFYGSIKDSIECLDVIVSYPKGTDKPRILIENPQS